MGQYPKTMKVGKGTVIVKSYPEEVATIKKIKRLQGVLYDRPQ